MDGVGADALGEVQSEPGEDFGLVGIGAADPSQFELAPVDEGQDDVAALDYRPELDQTHTRQYGLVAEEVAEVAPELVLNDEDGEPQTVRYNFVNAMLLNEVQKQRRLVEEQKTTIAGQEARIQDLEARLARLETALAADR